MPRIRVLGVTKLKNDAQCPFCKSLERKVGQEVEIVQDMDTGYQYASFHCHNCHENVMLKG